MKVMKAEMLEQADDNSIAAGGSLVVPSPLSSLPDGWRVAQVKEIADVVTGKTPSTKEDHYWGGSIPFITPVDLNGWVIDTAVRSVTESAIGVCKALPYGTVLVSCIGYIGKVGMVTSSVAVTNQQINAVVPKSEVADSWYLLYAFIFLKPRLADAASITTVPILNKSNFEATHIKLPPLPEQRAIAQALRTVQEAKEARQREAILERERKAALMQRLFTYGTRNEPRRMTDIGEFPISWRVISLGEIITLQRGKDLPVQDRKEGDIPIVGSNGIVGTHNRYVETAPVPGVATGRSGTIGLLTYVDRPYWPLNTALYVTDFKDNLSLFIYYWLHLFNFKKYAEGVSVPTLNRNNVHPVLFPLPPFHQQQEIAAMFRACDDKLTALEREAALLDELFRALLDELMTGRRRINDENGA